MLEMKLVAKQMAISIMSEMIKNEDKRKELVIILISVFIIKKPQDNEKEEDVSEVIEIFQKEAYLQVFIEQENDDIDNIEKQLRELEHIESVEFHSKEEALQEMKEKFSNNNLLDCYNNENNIFPNSFIIKIEISSIDDINEDYFNNIKKNISNIKGIEKISTHFETLIRLYKEEGINGLKECLDMLE